jgi:biopolymer transport protein ExbD
MSAALTLPRSGLYFIDVIACLLFCLTLALVGARFSREHSIEIELPQAPPRGGEAGSSLDPEVVTIGVGPSGPVLYLGEEALDFSALEARFRADPPVAVLIRAEPTPLSRVITMAHGAGVSDIQLGYETVSEEDAP